MYIEKAKKGYDIFIKMKCKGITHTSDSYRYHDSFYVSEERKEKVLKRLEFLETRENSHCYTTEQVELKNPDYVVRYKNGLVEVSSRLMWHQVFSCVKDEADITCVVGTMARRLTDISNIDNIGIHLDFIQRKLIATNWWKKGRRNYYGYENITTPIGFQEPEKTAMDHLFDLL
jgi:hypothetical protein